MKIAFVADTHFGYPRFEEDASRQGIAAMLDACEKADLILLGGDIFDSRVPRLETLAEVAGLLKQSKERLEKKAAGSIRTPNFVLGIHGTHERRGRDALNPIQMMARLGLMEDIHNKTVVVEREWERAALSGMGGLPDDLVSEALKRLSCKPADGMFNIFVFHQTMKEFVPQAQNVASIEELPQGYDMYLCGHIHTRMELAGGKLLIPGSTVITQLRKEDAEEKGYYIIDTVSRKAEFVHLKTRPYLLVEIDADGKRPGEIREKIGKALEDAASGHPGEKPIARIIVRGKVQPGSGALDFSGLGHSGVESFIESEAEGGSLAAEFESLRAERRSKASPQELAIGRLHENAKKAGITPERADELYQKFSEEN